MQPTWSKRSKFGERSVKTFLQRSTKMIGNIGIHATAFLTLNKHKHTGNAPLTTNHQ